MGRSVIKPIIRRHKLGWQWRVMDFESEVESGTERTWIEAQAAANAACKKYSQRVYKKSAK